MENIIIYSTLISSLATFATVIILIWQTRISRKTAHAEFTLRLHDMFFINNNNSKIIRCIEEKNSVLDRNRGKFSKSDLDDYLGIIELLAIYVNNGVLDKKTVEEMFGYYICLTWKNVEIQEYIADVRKNSKTDLYYKPFEKLAIGFINAESEVHKKGSQQATSKKLTQKKG